MPPERPVWAASREMGQRLGRRDAGLGRGAGCGQRGSQTLRAAGCKRLGSLLGMPSGREGADGNGVDALAYFAGIVGKAGDDGHELGLPSGCREASRGAA